jgi:hypothetical protein
VLRLVYSQPESIDRISPPRTLQRGGTLTVGEMASWLRHPRYVPVREALITHLQRTRYRFRRLDPVVFLCGGAGSKSRDALTDYLKKFASDLDVFYAERVDGELQNWPKATWGNVE